METYHKYFTELGIGKMLNEGKNPPQDLQKNVNVFTKGDQLCLYGNAILECQLQIRVTDVDNRKLTRVIDLPKAVINGFASWEPTVYHAGHYIYGVYVENKLVGEFPFEVIN